MFSEKPSVLACVSGQYDCDRIVEAAKKLAKEEDCELRVLTVIRPEPDYTIISDQIEYLNLVAREANADMTFLWSSVIFQLSLILTSVSQKAVLHLAANPVRL